MTSILKKLTHLTQDEKEELKIMYRSGKFTITEMADWFGVSKYMISKAIKEM